MVSSNQSNFTDANQLFDYAYDEFSFNEPSDVEIIVSKVVPYFFGIIGVAGFFGNALVVLGK